MRRVAERYYVLAAPEIPDAEFDVQDELPGILGEFVWTGFDYLGEPTPFYPWDKPRDMAFSADGRTLLDSPCSNTGGASGAWEASRRAGSRKITSRTQA